VEYELKPDPVNVTVVAAEPTVIGVVGLAAVITGATVLASPTPKAPTRGNPKPLLPVPVLVSVKLQTAAVTAVIGTVTVAVVGLVTVVTSALLMEPIVAFVMSVRQAPPSAVYVPPAAPGVLYVASETVAPYWKPEPSKLIVYEPIADSAEGLAFSRPLPTVKALASVVVPPSVFVTVTSNAPGVAAAEFAGFVGVTLRTIEVALTEVTDAVKAVPST
jgi:hypothetical protein